MLDCVGPVAFISVKVHAYLEKCALDTETCGRVMEIARKYGLSSLNLKLMEIVGADPNENLDIILSMDQATMCDFLSKDYLQLDEIAVLDLLRKWIEYSSKNSDNLDEVLSHIRWEVIPSEYIVESVATDPVFTQGSGAKPVMAAMSHHLSRSRLIMQKLRDRRTAKPTALIVGGVQNKTDSPIVLNDLNEDFAIPNEYLFYFNKLQGHQLLEINNFVFIIGGEYTTSDNKKLVSNNIFCLDLRLRSMTELRPMISRRTNFSASIVRDEIVVIGGRNERNVIVPWAEKFKISENKWFKFETLKNSEVTKLLTRYCHTQTTVNENQLLVSGGYVQEPGQRKMVCSEQIVLFDSRDMSVINSGTLNSRRCWHVAQAVDSDSVLVLGGSVQVGTGRRVGVLDIELINTSSLESETLGGKLPYPVSSPGLFKSGPGQLTVSGGWSETERRFLSSAMNINFNNATKELSLSTVHQYLSKHFSTHGALYVSY